MPLIMPIILEGISLGIQYGPGILAAANTELALLNGGGVASASQQAAIDAALLEAHTLLQARLAALAAT